MDCLDQLPREDGRQLAAAAGAQTPGSVGQYWFEGLALRLHLTTWWDLAVCRIQVSNALGCWEASVEQWDLEAAANG